MVAGYGNKSVISQYMSIFLTLCLPLPHPTLTRVHLMGSKQLHNFKEGDWVSKEKKKQVMWAHLGVRVYCPSQKTGILKHTREAVGCFPFSIRLVSGQKEGEIRKAPSPETDENAKM